MLFNLSMLFLITLISKKVDFRKGVVGLNYVLYENNYKKHKIGDVYIFYSRNYKSLKIL